MNWEPSVEMREASAGRAVELVVAACFGEGEGGGNGRPVCPVLGERFERFVQPLAAQF